MTATEKIADMIAMVDYITAMSIRYKTRISVFTHPPTTDKDRFVHVNIGQGSSDMSITGFGHKLSCSWRAPDGERKMATIEELQRMIAEEGAEA